LCSILASSRTGLLIKHTSARYFAERARTIISHTSSRQGKQLLSCDEYRSAVATCSTTPRTGQLERVSVKFGTLVDMSNRFVSGGTISSSGDDRPDQRLGEEKGASAGTNAQWEAVQKQLDAERQQREESRRKAIEGGERSLYDVLQENKGNSSPPLLRDASERMPADGLTGGQRRRKLPLQSRRSCRISFKC